MKREERERKGEERYMGRKNGSMEDGKKAGGKKIKREKKWKMEKVKNKRRN